jgi:hypothetical protein
MIEMERTVLQEDTRDSLTGTLSPQLNMTHQIQVKKLCGRNDVKGADRKSLKVTELGTVLIYQRKWKALPFTGDEYQ